MTPDKPETMRTRIMIVDDHPLVRRGIAAVIQAEPDFAVCALAGDADEARKALEKELPDLMLLDISMPGMNGIDLIRELRARYPELRVLVLSMHEEDVYAERALRSGANGYIMKDEPVAKILGVVRTVLDGGVYVSAGIAARLMSQSAAGGLDAVPRMGLEKLTNRELQVYTCIGEGLTSRKVAEKLNLSVRTVHVHREHIKRKMGFRNAPELVHHATHWVEGSDTRKAAEAKRVRSDTRPGLPGRPPPPARPCGRR